MFKEFVVSGDSHIIEPVDLFKTRLPRPLRDRALWEEEFTLDEPIVEGGHTEFKKLHTIGFDGWTISKYRQTGGETPDGEPDHIIRDMDFDGVDASVMFPNLSLFVLFTDDHELSMAHCRVWNDYLVERYLPYKERLRPTAAIPLTDVPAAVAEIERIARAGLGAILLPEIPPLPYWSREYDPVWAAAQSLGLPVFFHVATGGVFVKEQVSETATTVKGLMTAMNMGKGQLTDDMVSGRTMGGGNTASASPQGIIAALVGGGVCERFPDLHFNLTEFGAGWLVSYMGMMEKSWRMGIGQDPDWWLGFWDDSRPANDQPSMGRLFAINDKWPYPLKPTEYVQRQIHVQFADDPTAVKARHITGLSTITWGNDYPHAEGTFRSSADCVAFNFEGVGDDDRAAILGGTLADVAHFDKTKKLAKAPETV
ncbi:amidohydrolase [Amycolatopsis mediterranei S699]|uniref:Amidohydrolase n=2 Tax=Amycolatopsis mediterranei TaxID=33910 RepID=A0A0H3DDC3_AMYMU|nr:amidohydrolase [Amycolatopsis mediterranei U32]AEK45874.1 amidohydrolase [Amycolatopsis mediterranei S699]AFO80633.1 amidohydrolase [Amycolatopsis mediterranei S699]AGT87761.1 amidohydrolase [Amycolatopsis mediterranei RB]KDU93957.1 amidohydrolase [Amycolatopsis mediterranei]